MYPNTNLQPGQTGPEVKKLQDFLVSQGLMTQQQVATGPGTYGPQTTAAVKKYQEQNGVDNSSGPGYWGPRTIAAASGAGSTRGSGGSGSMPYSEEDYTNAVNSNPIISKYIAQGNTAQDIEYAVSSGDYSSLVNEYGQPFSLEQQQQALTKAQEDISGYYESLKTRETQDAENALAQKQADYQKYLVDSGQQFEQDKTQADQSAADRGVLFSGSRVQKEKNMQRAYEQDQGYKQGNLQRAMGATSQDYAYKYGDDAAKGLSQYYQAGSNVYNPKVASGGVTSGNISSLYKPGNYGFGGTRVAEQQSEAQKRAARLLANQGNKLLATGYQNQF